MKTTLNEDGYVTEPRQVPTDFMDSISDPLAVLDWQPADTYACAARSLVKAHPHDSANAVKLIDHTHSRTAPP